MQVDTRPEQLVQARDDVDLDVEIAQGSQDRRRVGVRLAREGDDHPLDLAVADKLRQLVERAEYPDVAEVCTQPQRLLVDQAEQAKPIFTVLTDLARDQLPDLAGADDDRVLDVGRRTQADAAREHPAAGYEQRRQDPEHDQLPRPRIGDPGQPAAEEEDPGAERDQMDDADEVVDGRIAEALIVVAVEAVHCREQHPGRQAEEEDGELVHRPRTGPLGAQPENEYAREERRRQSGRVCKNERAANQRPTAPRRLPHLPHLGWPRTESTRARLLRSRPQ